MATVYLLHFTQPYRHAGHYIGMTGKLLSERLAAHRGDHQHGRPARLLQALMADGGDFVLAASWEVATTSEAYALERRLKRWKANRRLCPICSPASKYGGEHSPAKAGRS